MQALGEAKVYQFYMAIGIYHDIFWLQVPINNFILMQDFKR